jgi:hypothetical protein
VRSEIRTKIGDYFVEGVRSIVGTPRTKIGKGVASGLLYALMAVIFIVGMIIYARMIGYP